MKLWVKKICRILGIVATAPLWGACLLHSALATGEGTFKACGEFLSLFPGRLGIILRCGFYRISIEAVSGDFSIGFGSYLSHRKVSLGRGVYIGNRCTGRECLDRRRRIDRKQCRHPERACGGSMPSMTLVARSDRKEVRSNRFGSAQTLGSETAQLSWTMSEKGSVIGAGSVVVRPIPPRSVAVGNPAKAIRERASQSESPRIASHLT